MNIVFSKVILLSLGTNLYIDIGLFALSVKTPPWHEKMGFERDATHRPMNKLCRQCLNNLHKRDNLILYFCLIVFMQLSFSVKVTAQHGLPEWLLRE